MVERDDECTACGGSGIEEVYGGNGTVLEVKCWDCTLDLPGPPARCGLLSAEDFRRLYMCEPFPEEY